MAVAGEASFTVSLASVWQKRPIITRLVLVDAEVDLERQANGLRNWRLTNPEYRGPGKIRVLLLEAHRSRIRFVNREAGLDLVGTSTPLANEGPGPRGERLDQHDHAGRRVQGREVLRLRAGRPVPHLPGIEPVLPAARPPGFRQHPARIRRRLRRSIRSGADGGGPAPVGPHARETSPFIRLHPAPSRPYRFEAHVKQAGDIYEVSRLRGTIGDTDIAGEVRYDRSRDRPFVGAALRSDRADYADLAALAGVRAADGSRDAPPEGRKAARKESARNATVPSVFPAQPLPVDALQKFDAEVSVKARELRTAGRALLHNVHVDARLADGAIETRALDFEVAGGRVSGALAFDGASEPPAARVVVDLNAVRLEQLFAALSLPARAAGAIDGRVDLAGRGDSVAALLASSNGSLRVNVSGGRIPNLLDAKLALNPLTVFGAWLSSKTDVAVHCAAAALDVHGGVGEVRTIALDTDRARVEGAGRVDLGEERLDLLLTPHAKRPGILDRHEAIRVRGPFRGPKVSREKRAQQESRAPSSDRRVRCG